MGTPGSELEELRRIARFFHSIVENIPNMVFVKDAEDLRFVLCNRAGEELLGVPQADLLGKTDYDLFPADEADFFRSKDMETIRGGVVVEIPEESVLSRGHGERLLHTKKIVIADDGKPRYLLGISQDITARRQAELELERLRTAVAAAVVHDLRAPLQAILLQVDLLASHLAGDEDSQSGLAMIRGSVRHLVRLTNDMLDATRVSIEDLPLEREVVDPTMLVATIVDVVGAGLVHHLIELRRLGPIPQVSVDPVRLEQILRNLLENAAKYARPSTLIRVELEREGDGVCIRVIDQGPGIDPNDMPRLFERFFQAKSAREQRTGFGLGLFITKGLVLAHGGRIDVESEPGKGSVFRVWLPAVTRG